MTVILQSMLDLLKSCYNWFLRSLLEKYMTIKSTKSLRKYLLLLVFKTILYKIISIILLLLRETFLKPIKFILFLSNLFCISKKPQQCLLKVSFQQISSVNTTILCGFPIVFLQPGVFFICNSGFRFFRGYIFGLRVEGPGPGFRRSF